MYMYIAQFIRTSGFLTSMICKVCVFFQFLIILQSNYSKIYTYPGINVFCSMLRKQIDILKKNPF